MRREVILKKFMWGLSILNSYIDYNGKLNLHDINIFAETMMCDLLNILFNLVLKNANSNRLNNPIYDLISLCKDVRFSRRECVYETQNKYYCSNL